MGIYGPVALALVTVAQAVALAVIAGDFAGRSIADARRPPRTPSRTRPC